MQKKKDNLFGKFVKKNYNNELEKVLEGKDFSEHTKSLLLSIMYKIEAAYKDYEKVKQNVETKEEYIDNIINIINNKCNKIQTVNLNSENAAKILGNKTFMINKKQKEIICYPIERKMLYAIAKISKYDLIINDNYFVINKTLSDLINVGNNIHMLEPLRDFNGYSWTTISSEIESIDHNTVYQNLRGLLGHKFMNGWIRNKEFIVDYMAKIKETLSEKYGQENQKEIVDLICKISILLEMKFDKKQTEVMLKAKNEIENNLEKMKDREQFIEDLTKEKREITNRIRKTDTILNNKELLQNEYVQRNKQLPLENKIFSIRVLTDIMIKEREKDFKNIEKINNLLMPKNFIEAKANLEKKDEYLKTMDIKDFQKEIKKLVIKLQKVYLRCLKIRIDKIETKEDLLKMIYEFRYYCLMPYDREKNINQIASLKKDIKEIQCKILKKAKEGKLLELDLSLSDNLIENKVIDMIFTSRVIDLEEISIKITKEQETYYMQIFDDKSFEEKMEICKIDEIDKKELTLKLNKKMQVFDY